MVEVVGLVVVVVVFITVVVVVVVVVLMGAKVEFLVLGVAVVVVVAEPRYNQLSTQLDDLSPLHLDLCIDHLFISPSRHQRNIVQLCTKV